MHLSLTLCLTLLTLSLQHVAGLAISEPKCDSKIAKCVKVNSTFDFKSCTKDEQKSLSDCVEFFCLSDSMINSDCVNNLVTDFENKKKDSPIVLCACQVTQ